MLFLDAQDANFVPGTKVMLIGLSSARGEELNGTRGVLKTFSKKKERWGVQRLHADTGATTDEFLSIKPKNLILESLSGTLYYALRSFGPMFGVTKLSKATIERSKKTAFTDFSQVDKILMDHLFLREEYNDEQVRTSKEACDRPFAFNSKKESWEEMWNTLEDKRRLFTQQWSKHRETFASRFWCWMDANTRLNMLKMLCPYEPHPQLRPPSWPLDPFKAFSEDPELMWQIMERIASHPGYCRAIDYEILQFTHEQSLKGFRGPEVIRYDTSICDYRRDGMVWLLGDESGNITPGKIICINRSHPDCISESLEDTINKYNDIQKSGLVVISFKAFEWAYHIQTIQIDLISQIFDEYYMQAYPDRPMKLGKIAYGCANCKNRTKANGRALDTCNGCKRVHYCSRKCQKNHWKKKHKHDCKKFAAQMREAYCETVPI